MYWAACRCAGQLTGETMNIVTRLATSLIVAFAGLIAPIAAHAACVIVPNETPGEVSAYSVAQGDLSQCATVVIGAGDTATITVKILAVDEGSMVQQMTEALAALTSNATPLIYQASGGAPVSQLVLDPVVYTYTYAGVGVGSYDFSLQSFANAADAFIGISVFVDLLDGNGHGVGVVSSPGSLPLIAGALAMMLLAAGMRRQEPKRVVARA